ncbi:MAG: 4Fe-4S binding protein [Sedimentisphaerales bacterium]|nr:4Fe-4S binding protein [Sedimentisphaerales bacterium]
MKYQIIKEKCLKCGRCREVCPAEAIVKGEIIQEKCRGCGACVKVCAYKAIVPVESENKSHIYPSGLCR